jgi:hypothetical protein
MNRISTLLIFILLQTKLFAQDATVRNCGTNEYMHHLAVQHPEMETERMKIEQHTRQYMQQGEKKTRTIITIPVVVHVVYNLAVQNISDAQINSQMLVLNKDFRKLNTDFVNTPGSFQPLAADCQIEFVLAKRDPNGDSTTGITRTFTNTTSFTANNNVKNAVTGGKNAWPATQYLNIWVCKLSGGLLGYGQFPGGPEATDGVVISYKAFGTSGAALPPFNKGRTATHEIGHWLNLFHIWGDDGGGCAGSDLADDTPNQGAENTGVPVYPHISCNNAPFGDMFMNYMDYSDDIAMTMFTINQKARMDALFTAGGSRFALLSSQGGNYPVPPAACAVPAGFSTSGITAGSAQINWNAVAGATSYQLSYKKVIDTAWTSASTVANQFVINNLTAATNYEYKVRTVCPSGISAYAANGSFTTLPAVNSCIENYEPNNTLFTAVTVPTDSNLSAMISYSADNDYYRVEISEFMPNVRVSLTDLPQDYDLYLYNIRGGLLSTSLSGGLTNEEIIQNTNYNGAITYYVRVKGYNGAFSNAACYKLNIQTSASAFKFSAPTVAEESKPEFMLYPVPANDHLTCSVFYEGIRDAVCNVYNFFGQKVSSQKLITHEGFNEIHLETAGLASGMYMLEVLDSEERRVQKFMVKR